MGSMAKEIERKFLVIKNLLPKLKNGVLYIQGYLCLQPLIRFRIIGKKVILNIKHGKMGSITRDEWEFFNNLDDKEIRRLIGLSCKKPIEKIRYKIKHKNLVWEIDAYQKENEGLITVEAEIPSENHQIEFPSWVDSKQEITHNPRYFNANLGENPYKEFAKF